MTEPPNNASVIAIKSVSFRYTTSKTLSSLFEDFRCMCNDAIRTAIQLKPKSRFKLIELAYSRLKEYGLHTHYILSACEVAYSVYRNKRRKSVPYIRKTFLKLDNQSYQLKHLLLRIPTTPGNFVFLILQGSDYHRSFVDDPSLKRGSVTINDRTVNIAFSKEVETLEPMGFIGIDVNERNTTVSSTLGWHHRFTELGDVVEIKERYKESRAKIGKMTRGDRRTCKRLLAKYGEREKNRTIQRIHSITKHIVDYAREHKFGMKMEKLGDIRRLYAKTNGQGALFRGRMNTWVFAETQNQISYKSKWFGLPDYFVDPRGTSSYCLCGSRVVRLADRRVYCPTCDKNWDRDDLASKNIVACAVPQARPFKGCCDGERGDDGSNPQSGWREGKACARG